jgi:hypothetical protein
VTASVRRSRPSPGRPSSRITRKWSGKTLAVHKADRAAVVRQALEEAGIDPDDHDELSVVGSDGRWSWELLGRNRVDAPTYAAAIAQVIRTRQRWRTEYDAAKSAAAAARASPVPPEAGVSSAIRQLAAKEGSSHGRGGEESRAAAVPAG